MAKYDVETEVMKIKIAFDKVKDDVISLKKNLILNERKSSAFENEVYQIDKKIVEIINLIDKDKKNNEIDILRNYIREILKAQKEDRIEIEKLKRYIIANKNKIENNETYIKSNMINKNDNRKILANINSGKVHYSNCPYLKNTKVENLKEYSDVKSALKDGYKKCQCIFNF